MAAPPFDALYGLEIETADADEAPRRGRPSATACASPPGSSTAASTPRWPSRSPRRHRRPRRAGAAVGHSSQTSFLRPITDGTVHATGRRRHRGRTTWVWEFDITDDDERLCALVRMTVARPRSAERTSTAAG